jgi:biopolymer transport protein ExbB
MIVLELLLKGGWMMFVIAAVSVVALAITLERVVVLFLLSRLNVTVFLRKIVKLVEDRDYAAAIEACNIKSKHPLPAVMKAGLSKANRREKEIERAMEEEMLRALPRVQRGISFLSLLGNSATLLGLLGTIFGLIRAFSGVSAASASARQQVLAEGISMAMFTTAFGLIVAVPILFAYTIVNSKMEKTLIQTEQGSVALLGALAGRLTPVRQGQASGRGREGVA